MIWLSGLNRTVTRTHKNAPWLCSLARQFILAGLFYLFIKLAPAARPLSFLNVWPWRVARGAWVAAPDPPIAPRSCATVAALLDHRIRGLRRAAARRLRVFTAPAGTVRGPFFLAGAPGYRVKLRSFRSGFRGFRAAHRGFRHGGMGHVFDK